MSEKSQLGGGVGGGVGSGVRWGGWAGGGWGGGGQDGCERNVGIRVMWGMGDVNQE